MKIDKKWVSEIIYKAPSVTRIKWIGVAGVCPYEILKSAWKCVLGKGKGKVNRVLQLATRLTGHMGSHRWYLPPGSGDIPAFTLAEAGTRLSNPRGMQGYRYQPVVDLVGWLHTKMVYPPEDSHPSKY